MKIEYVEVKEVRRGMTVKFPKLFTDHTLDSFCLVTVGVKAGCGGFTLATSPIGEYVRCDECIFNKEVYNKVLLSQSK